MREIVLDTETTGFRPNDGDRIVEIGCIELVNHVTTGNTYHQYINPERNIPDEAFDVHGLSEEFLTDFPVMADVMGAFIEFIGDAPLVIHNAEFDIRFINAELSLLGQELLPMSRSVDTVRMAREKFPGAPASLDALCRRFSIDNSNRTLHGALLDAELLADVYLELIGGRQADLELARNKVGDALAVGETQRRDPRPHAASATEKSAHAAFLEKIKDPLWTN
jgi:DNA polymerase-3 subunit epsilon